MTTNPIRTGLPTLDTLLGGGLRPGLTLVAGRSQSGMTTLLDTIACAAAFGDQVPTVLADLETATHHRMLRLSSALSGVPLVDMQRGTLTAEQAATIRTSDQAGAPFWFADDTRSVNELRWSLGNDGIAARLLLVDGLRFLSDGDPAGVTGELAALAADQGIAVVATHPAPWDGGHTGGAVAALGSRMVNNADSVVLLHRPGLGGGTPHPDEVGVTVPVSWHGESGWFPLVGDFPHARFREPAPTPAATS